MIKLENYEVIGWEHAIRGMRNPMNSWDKSDSFMCDSSHCDTCKHRQGVGVFCNDANRPDGMVVGPNDLDLMTRLRNAGTDHRKFMRMIAVYVDITAPLYWWKEFDTYKVGTVANSCSTMHKIQAKEFTLEDFSTDHLMIMTDLNLDISTKDFPEYFPKYDTEFWDPVLLLEITIKSLNFYRNKYIETSKKPMKEESKRAELMKKYWWQMIQLLPSSYNQKRTVMLNYEVLANIYKSRKNHKLDEWRELCAWIEQLPYSELITG